MTTLTTTTRRPLLDPPGGILMWIVVALELAVFSMVFALIALLRVGDPDTFAAAQRALDPSLGLAMTCALVTSGWLAAEGVHAFRGGRVEAARRWLIAAALIGAAFVGLKLHDYAAKYGAGHGLGSGDFWDAYLLGTGFHFAHVIVGVGLLAYAAARIREARFDDAETAVVGTALFWHMCDVAWFFLYPLFYVRS